MDRCPGWVAGFDQGFEELLREVAWTQRRRWMYDQQVEEPRLTSWQKIDEQTVIAYTWLEDARAVLSERYGVRFDSLGINLYRDGADSVAWHRDRIPPRSWIPSWPCFHWVSHEDSFSALWEVGRRAPSLLVKGTSS